MEQRTSLTEIIEYIDPGSLSYQDWVNVGMALKLEGYPVSVWDQWSQKDFGRYHAGECEKKWRSFSGSSSPVTGGTIVQMAMERGWVPEKGHELDWNDSIQVDSDRVVVDKNWLEGREIQEPKNWNPAEQLITYLETLFEAGENVGYVTGSWEKTDEKGTRWLPQKGSWDRTAGQLIEAKLDIVMANDITGPMALPILKQMADQVFDKEKVVFVPDHFTPNKDIKSAENSKAIREFAKEQGLKWYFEQGKSGVEHAILPEAGVVTAGECIIGADSHTCTYGALGAFSTGMGTTDVATGMATGEIWFKVPSAIKFVLTGKPSKYVSGKDIIIHIIGQIGVDGALYKSMEFTGDGIACLSMDDRFTMANMAIEAGAKNGIFPVDDKTIQYLNEHTKKEYTVYEADEDAEYEQVVEIDLAEVRPTVAFPHLPGNAKTIDEIEAMEPIKIDQVVIGSCTNGRMEDMRKAAAILKGHKVHEDVRVMVIPATQKIYKQCIHEGLMDIFVDAGCAVNTPSCGPCMGGHMGVMAAGEKCVSTTNRNFVGRMGHVDSLIYLASPEVAAASAIAGCIANPEKVGEK